VIIPIQCEFFALAGVTQLLMTIRSIQKKVNKKLSIEGVLLTMFNSGTNLSKEVVDDVNKHFKEKVYQTIIKRNITLAEATGMGMPICEYDAKCQGCKDYQVLAKEVIQRNNIKTNTN